MRLTVATAFILSAATPCVAQTTSVAQMPDTLGSFEFYDVRGDVNRPLKVWYSRPSGSKAATRVVFLLHGSSRTGQQAQQLGAPFARTGDFVLIAPEFSEEHYPETVYDFGGVTDPAGRVRPDSAWSLNVIEHLFDAVRKAIPSVDSTYDIVGHSAGGQFVHRLVLFVPQARFRRAVVSSPGRFAMPTWQARFPYGLIGSPADSNALRKAFSRDVVIILGDRDVADQTRQREPETIAQGKNRLARGLRFFATAAEQAFDLGVPLGWQLQIVHGVDHDPPRMVRAALEVLRR